MNSHPSNSEQSRGFDQLAEPVQRWIWDKGWNSLRDIQERAIPILLNDDRDVIIAAATAGGKTEAAFLPLISSVLENPGESGFDLVYVGPLRALINDQFERLEDLCAKTELPVFSWHGDIAQGVKARARKKPRGILLITPESLEALFVLRGLEIPTLFMGVRAIVIDELHALLDTERGIHLRSLLTRLELAVGHRIRRVGLSATLGEITLTREYLRPEAPEAVELLVSKSDNQALKVQIRGYLKKEIQYKNINENEDDIAAHRAVTEHLFKNLRGQRNLIFAGSRQNVEVYADALREMSEKTHLPAEFFPHHGSLSREHRIDLEKRLKTNLAITAICTSTLELGIDIGDIACVAHIGAPYSVASLRQRLGRSGRRSGQPAVLRMYAIEEKQDTNSHPLKRLDLRIIRSIAMIELLIERWCEPPASQALHLSTLTHQILSVIAEHGGVNAKRLYIALCKKGPFRQVDSRLFSRLLRQIGMPDMALIEQSPDGDLLLGRQGEWLVEHYSFYSVFQTPQEYRIIADGKTLGTLSIPRILTSGMTIIFSGRRWRITKICDEDKVVEVTADRTGRPPNFSGNDGGLIHDRVVDKMKEVLASVYIPAYLNNTGVQLLKDACSEFQRLNFTQQPIHKVGKGRCIVFTGVGTIKTSTLALILESMGYETDTWDGFIDINYNEDIQSLEDTFEEIACSEQISTANILCTNTNLRTEKFHRYLNFDLLLEDAISRRIDLDALPKLVRKIIDNDI